MYVIFKRMYNCLNISLLYCMYIMYCLNEYIKIESMDYYLSLPIWKETISMFTP